MMPPPTTASFTLAQLQTETAVWIAKNFAGPTPHPPHRPLLGIVEELGELDAADAEEDVEDAVADTVVFMADFCNAHQFDLQSLFAEAVVSLTGDKRFGLLESVGRLCHSVLKLEQGIRGTPAEHKLAAQKALIEILVSLLVVARAHSFSFLGAVEKTWLKVRDRVWRCQEPGCFVALARPHVCFCDHHMNPGHVTAMETQG